MKSRGLLIVIVLVVVAALMGGCSYNEFTTQEQGVKAQWAQVENQLQRRSDLIPNLMETVKGFAQQERDVFQAVADARAKLAGAQTSADKIEAANQQSTALSRLLVVVEAYPQLKSDANFRALQDSLENTENRLATERRRYNERIQEYSVTLNRFPNNIMARAFGFKEYPYFAAPAEAKGVPKVDFKRVP